VIREVRSRDGVRLACEASGSGPPLVMVHGAGSARWSFDLVRPLLEHRFTVVGVDRRGRGDSSDAGLDAYTLEREIEDVDAVLSDVGAGAVLFGHSYGGLIAAAAAVRADGLAGLVLYEPPMGGVLAHPEWVDRLEGLIGAGPRDQAVTEFMRDVGGYSDPEIDAMRGTPAWEARQAAVPTVIRELRAEHGYRLSADALGELAVRTLMLVGTESPDWARRSTEAYAAAIPGATVVSLEGEGHGASASAPELVAAEILSFAE
jgi:pimeloyl-ACP methyl ester carboxylesterase